MEAHPNQTYYVLKTIILTNLYGVDIMQEAVEICKLRLFLTLVAQVEPDGDAPNLGIEPLPDIDLNIRAGNTLVGFTSLEEVRRAMTFDAASGNYRMLSAEDEATLARIDESAELADRAYQRFRQMQAAGGMDVRDFSATKAALRTRLSGLGHELDSFLAGRYGVDVRRPVTFTLWRESHQPFHWMTEFYGIMRAGGFDAIIGNPP